MPRISNTVDTSDGLTKMSAASIARDVNKGWNKFWSKRNIDPTECTSYYRRHKKNKK